MTQDTLSAAFTALEAGFQSFQKNQKQRLEKLEEKMAGLPFASRGSLGALNPALMKGLREADSRWTSSLAFDAYLRGQSGEIKTLSAGEIPGSYLLPEGLQERISKGLNSSFISFRSLARHMTISGGSVEVIIDRNLPTVGWVTEMAERPETDPGSLAKIKIPLHELYAKPRATQKLLDDGAINIEEWLVSKVTEKMLRIENQTFILGDGEGKPRGFLTYPMENEADFGTLQHFKTGANGAFRDERPTDVLFDMVASMKAEYLGEAVWLVSRSAQNALQRLRVPGTGHYLWQPALSEKPLPTLLGYPVYVMEAIPPLTPGTASCSLVFGNFKEGYQVIEKPQLSILRDPYSAKPYVEFYITKRIGGDVIDFDAIKVLKFETLG